MQCFTSFERACSPRPETRGRTLETGRERSHRKQEILDLEPERPEEERVDPNPKKDKTESTKTEALGLNPNLAQQRARSQVQKEYCVSASGTNSVNALHEIGQCYMVPGIEYPRYVHTCRGMPRLAASDSICKLCSRKEEHRSRTGRLRRYADVVFEDGTRSIGQAGDRGSQGVHPGVGQRDRRHVSCVQTHSVRRHRFSASCSWRVFRVLFQVFWCGFRGLRVSPSFTWFQGFMVFFLCPGSPGPSRGLNTFSVQDGANMF